MLYTTEQIARNLKQARVGKQLSQRALAVKAGVPQSHISRIERGAVDLRVSSLIEMARVLDLELFLVPRKAAPAVEAVVSDLSGGGDADQPGPAYSLDGDEDGV